jgi:hypothetical protein
MAEHNRNREQQAAERAAALGAFGEGFKAGADPMRGRRGRILDQDPERHRHFRAGFEAGRRAAEQAVIDYRAKLLALASSPPAPDPEAAALAAGLAAGLAAPSTPSGRQADEETGVELELDPNVEIEATGDLPWRPRRRSR